jgi:hypothetical protein
MDKREFADLRNSLDKTQKQMAELLGSSVRAIHSYEQGWRPIPSHIERQAFFLVAMSRSDTHSSRPCWLIKKCPNARKTNCPAWEYQAGTLCWLINGTICKGRVHKNWQEKMKICRSCEVFAPLLSNKP